MKNHFGGVSLPHFIENVLLETLNVSLKKNEISYFVLCHFLIS